MSRETMYAAEAVPEHSGSRLLLLFSSASNDVELKQVCAVYDGAESRGITGMGTLSLTIIKPSCYTVQTGIYP